MQGALGPPFDKRTYGSQEAHRSGTCHLFCEYAAVPEVLKVLTSPPLNFQGRFCGCFTLRHGLPLPPAILLLGTLPVTPSPSRRTSKHDAAVRGALPRGSQGQVQNHVTLKDGFKVFHDNRAAAILLGHSAGDSTAVSSLQRRPRHHQPHRHLEPTIPE